MLVARPAPIDPARVAELFADPGPEWNVTRYPLVSPATPVHVTRSVRRSA